MRPPPSPELWRSFARFLWVGGHATALQYLLLLLFAGPFGIAPVVASSMAYAISATANYFASHAFAFRSSRSHGSALPRFAFMSAIGFGLNAALVWIGFDGLHLHYLLAQVLATATTLGWNYVVSLRWTFASRSP